MSERTNTLIAAGWTIEYSDSGVVAYLVCRWCKGKARRMKHCSLCRGTGAEQKRRLS